MRFIYFNRTKEQNKAGEKGIICVGYEYTEDKKFLNVVASFCAPGDTFDKKYHVHKRLPERYADGKYSTIKVGGDKHYEEVVALVKQELNNSFPEGYASVRAFVEEHKYKLYPTFAGTRLPFWFKTVD